MKKFIKSFELKVKHVKDFNQQKVQNIETFYFKIPTKTQEICFVPIIIINIQSQTCT